MRNRCWLGGWGWVSQLLAGPSWSPNFAKRVQIQLAWSTTANVLRQNALNKPLLTSWTPFFKNHSPAPQGAHTPAGRVSGKKTAGWPQLVAETPRGRGLPGLSAIIPMCFLLELCYPRPKNNYSHTLPQEALSPPQKCIGARNNAKLLTSDPTTKSKQLP